MRYDVKPLPVGWINPEVEKLAFALVSRVLTDEEMAEVARKGIDLFVRNMVSYKEEDMHRRLNDALLQQFKIRAIAAQVAKDSTR